MCRNGLQELFDCCEEFISHDGPGLLLHQVLIHASETGETNQVKFFEG